MAALKVCFCVVGNGKETDEVVLFFLFLKDVVPEWCPSEAVDMDLNNQAMVTDSKSLSTEMPLVTSLREAAKMGGKGTSDDESLRTSLQIPASTVIF